VADIGAGAPQTRRGYPDRRRTSAATDRWMSRKSTVTFSYFLRTRCAADRASGFFYGRAERSKATHSLQGGGEMILSVDYDQAQEARRMFRAGTPDISGAIAFHTAMDYLDGVAVNDIAYHDKELGAYALKNFRDEGESACSVDDRPAPGWSDCLLDGIHAHDVVTVADQRGVALEWRSSLQSTARKKTGQSPRPRAQFLLL